MQLYFMLEILMQLCTAVCSSGIYKFNEYLTYNPKFKSRDITLLTKVHLIRAMVFPVVTYGCESWTIMKAVAAAAAKSLELCLTLCNPIDGSPPGSSIPGILQARTLRWVAISFSNSTAFSLLYGPTLTSIHDSWKNHNFD